jgi:hypothetical protein
MSILTVFGLATIEIWFAVPAGLALGVPPLVLWLATLTGSLLSVTVVAFAGDALRAWLVRKRGGSVLAGQGRLYRVWVRYGVIGWGLASPLVFAPPMGTAIGLILGAPRRRLLAWMAAGTILWTTILVAAGVVGLDIVHLGLG